MGYIVDYHFFKEYTYLLVNIQISTKTQKMTMLVTSRGDLT